VCVFLRMHISHIGHSTAGSDVQSQVATNIFFLARAAVYSVYSSYKYNDCSYRVDGGSISLWKTSRHVPVYTK